MRLLSNEGRVPALLLMFSGLVAATWWWLMPGGFPLEHKRFWTNTTWPALIVSLCLAGFVAHCRGRRDVTAALAWFVAVAGCSIAFATYAIYYDMLSRVAMAMRIVGCGIVVVAYFGAGRPRPHVIMLLLAGPAIAGGCFFAWALRADLPSTRPLDVDMPDVATHAAVPAEPTVKLSVQTTVSPIAGSVEIEIADNRIWLQPLLTFESVSQSGGWTIFSVQGPERTTPFSRLPSMITTSDQERLFFGDRTALRVADRGAVEIEAFSRLPGPVYSHLNTFCALTIVSAGLLQFEFSPCGSERIAPQFADYPVGRPARFAYCDAARKFHVVEASSGEKGPFKELASGSLSQYDRLSITVVVAGKPTAKIHFDDWAAQLSTALSPTAGWGVAANAIEFQRIPYDTDNLEQTTRDRAMIWFTLAGTSVGRGWDTVGHKSGTYRNRVVIEPLVAPPSSPP
jgi:hypothetical protein